MPEPTMTTTPQSLPAQNVQLSWAARLEIDHPRQAFDQVAISGTATLSGTLNVTLFNGFAPATGNVFVIMTYTGTPVGNFTTILLPPGCSAKGPSSA